MSNDNMNSLKQSLKVLYENKSYDDVINQLIQSKNSLDKDIFHYNLGTAYFQKGELAIARYHLEKSLSYKQTDHAVQGLHLTKQKLGLSKEIASMDKFDQAGFVVANWGLDNYVISGLSCLFIFFIFLLKIRTLKKTLCTLFLILFIFIISLGFYVDQRVLKGIVLRDSSLRSGPSEIYPVITNLKPGQNIIITKKIDGWLLIKFPRAFTGWMNQNEVGLY